MNERYPELRERLERLMGRLSEEAPGPMAGFSTLRRQALTDGFLPRKSKELIALGIAIAIRCDGCIAYHVRDALKAGATHEEVVETIGVAVMMGGGPAAIYGSEALEALEQFELSPVG
jgi:AhpD family alkylhydroperoxidase